MSFGSPLWLVGLALLPLAAGAYLLVERRRRGVAARFARPALVPNLVPRAPGRRRHVPAAVLLAALALFLVGLARPQAVLSVTREEATVVLAVDVSFSMAAKDVAPTRLAAARAALEKFAGDVPSKFRIGVVAFADKAVVVAPATDDRTVVETALRELRLGQGTALGDAIVRSLQVVRRAPPPRPGRLPAPVATPDDVPAAILLVSDGAQTSGRVTPQAAAQRARALGVPVFTVALGTQEGVVERPLAGGFKERIQVPPDPKTLQAVAEASGGRFFSAPDADALKAVYQDLGSRLGRKDARREITVAFVGAGGLLLLLAGGLSSLWFQRLP